MTTTSTEAHTFTRRAGTMGRTDTVCSCGWTESTNVPSTLGRTERSHTAAMAREAERAARRAAR